MAQDLPKDASPSLVDAAERQAYQRCLDFEATASPAPKHPVPGVFEPVAARILGYMLLFPPCPEGATVIASEINQCADNRALHVLGNMFKDFVLRCFRSYRNDEFPTGTPSPPSSDPHVQITSEVLADPRMDHSTSRRIALIRDGGRCVLKNHIVDYTDYESGNHPVPSFRDGVDEIGVTQSAHIFPRETTINLGEGDKDEYASTVVALLERYGGVDLQTLLMASEMS
ncbi:hypothetical protein OF83DRAFT_742899 [Amylostereum chailletii]|nr:hypothetical protein OF83DRAFT_742899 [Amylostereum chailletii]